ncbi:MAG TPA: MBL fold metallo-hydrolase [Gemmatimonadales bacterium]|nr:MBL fold metallo-hydrolase [Gemmatimonadales bacterium]
MNLATPLPVGRLKCWMLEGGLQHLDGGAMFGVVPKPLWERRIAADERNRIPLAMRCLLVEHPDGAVLVDTGLGNKENEKFREIYGVQNTGRAGPTQLEDALAAAGFQPGDVRWVINTHLHFDHAGGNTSVTGGTPPRLSFPNATYVVQRGELEFALHPPERAAASYLAHNFVPVSQADRWRLSAGDTELLPGIQVRPTPGHTPHHQSVWVTDGPDCALFIGDLVPTSAHLPLPWIMGYDLEPMVTLETKRRVLAQAEAEGWTLVFEHDPVIRAGRVVKEGKSYGCAPLDTP